MTLPVARASSIIPRMPSRPLFNIGISAVPCLPNNSTARAALSTPFGICWNTSATWNSASCMLSVVIPSACNFAANAPALTPEPSITSSMPPNLRENTVRDAATVSLLIRISSAASVNAERNVTDAPVA